jgi:translation initiation factor 5
MGLKTEPGEEERIPIPFTANDPGYRYTRPQIQTTYTTQENRQVLTFLPNLARISRILRVSVDILARYLADENKCTSQLPAGSETPRLSGTHSVESLEKALNKFIDRYMLCKSCQFPEIVVSGPQNGIKIKTTCLVCGHVRYVSPTTPFEQWWQRSLSQK